jgi:hypothetical protein
MTKRLLAITVLTAGCVDPPIEWREPTVVAVAGDSVLVDGDSLGTRAGRLSIGSSGAATLVMPVMEAPPTLPSDANRCPSSLRMVGVPDSAASSRLDAVWWSVRADSSAVLRAATSRDGGRQWSDVSIVDSLDRSDVGCRRPPPSIARTGTDVHITYSMRAPEGTGVFFSHSMEMPGMVGFFHAPVSVVYGGRLVRVAVASEGNVVAVAFEDPNGDVRRIGIALSRTQGHVFATHTIASPGSTPARDPDLAMRGADIAVAWTTSSGARVLRNGRIR